jgi:hypothetical protein
LNRNKRSAINDVTQFRTFFDSPSPIVTLFVTEALALLSLNPRPPHRDVIYGQPLNKNLVSFLYLFNDLAFWNCEEKGLLDKFAPEDDNETHVQVVQSETPHWALVVVVEGHGEHVETDEDHDDHVELLVRHDAENNGLRFPLQHKHKNCNLSFKNTFASVLGF